MTDVIIPAEFEVNKDLEKYIIRRLLTKGGMTMTNKLNAKVSIHGNSTDKLNYKVSIRSGCYFSRTSFTYRDDALQSIREEVDSLENTKLEYPIHIILETI